MNGPPKSRTGGVVVLAIGAGAAAFLLAGISQSLGKGEDVLGS